MKLIKINCSKILVLAALCLGGCSFFTSAPKAVVQKYLSSAKAFELKEMDGLMSDRLINQMGREKISRDNERFADAVQGKKHKMEIITETVSGDAAKLVFFYKDAEKNDSVRLGFKLIKQNGDWKIDSYGFGDPDEAAPTPDANIPMPPLSDDFVPPPPPEPETAKTPKAKR